MIGIGIGQSKSDAFDNWINFDNFKHIEYDVVATSPFYVINKKLSLKKSSSNNNNESASATNNLLNVAMGQHGGPGVYPCQITLKSKKFGDVRVYNVSTLIQSQGTYAQLEFDTPVNEPITQKLPIVNSSDSDWKVNANWAENVHDNIKNTKIDPENVTASNTSKSERYKIAFTTVAQQFVQSVVQYFCN